MTTTIKLVLILALVAGAAALGWNIVSTYNGAIERAEQAEAAVAARDKLLLKARDDLKGAEATNKAWETRLAAEAAAQEKLLSTLADRDRDRARLTKERNDARASLTDLRRADPSVEAWAAAPVPAAVIARLRGSPGSPGNGGGQAAPGAGGGPPAAVAPR